MIVIHHTACEAGAWSAVGSTLLGWRLGLKGLMLKGGWKYTPAKAPSAAPSVPQIPSSPKLLGPAMSVQLPGQPGCQLGCMTHAGACPDSLAALQEDSCPDYMLKAEDCLRAEEARVASYLHINSKTKLMSQVCQNPCGQACWLANSHAWCNAADQPQFLQHCGCSRQPAASCFLPSSDKVVLPCAMTVLFLSCRLSTVCCVPHMLSACAGGE